MTSTRLTQQNRSQGWAAALPRCYPHTPSPTPGSSWHGSDAGSDTTQFPGLASYETHKCARVGGWVQRTVGAPTGSALVPCLGAPKTTRKGGLPPPLRAPSSPRYRTRSIAAPTSEGVPPSAPKPCLPIPSESIAGRATRIRPCSHYGLHTLGFEHAVEHRTFVWDRQVVP